MSVNGRSLFFCWIFMGAVIGIPVANAAVDNEPATERQPVPVQGSVDEPTPDASPIKADLAKQRRRRIVTVAFYVLGGILFVGLMLIVLTLLWGSRTRRVARKPLPKQSPGDPLWYLRPNKQADVSDAAPEDAAEAGPQDDDDETA